MCTLNNENNNNCRQLGPKSARCQVPVGGDEICGETQSLSIINEFKMLYEKKMEEIDTEAGGDCLQEKIHLQQEWIGDLTEQNQMLIRAVHELEYEATERVQMLEEKLQQSAQCICEVMKKYRQHDVTQDLLAEPLQRIFHFENDVKNLLELIRRGREEDRWSTDGLTFYEVSEKDLFGNTKSANEDTDDAVKLEGEKKLAGNESVISELQQQVKYYNSFGDVESMAKELTCKNSECESLKQSMADMREALTEEVAVKHDKILELKRDIQRLEDRCIQADKQTAFRDDIIKELRKEIKQYKQQVTQGEMSKLHSTIEELYHNIQNTKELQEQEEKVNQEKLSGLKQVIDQLRHNLSQAQQKYENDVKTCKICRGRSKVGFVDSVEVQVTLDDNEEQISKQLRIIEKKEEIIQIQRDTLNMIQLELRDLKEKEVEMRNEKERTYHEVQHLKTKVTELENALRDSEERANNLQMAVDLYLNSVNVLEASEEKSKIEIEQQKLSILNLQEALVLAKQELDEVRRKSEEHVSLGWASRWFGGSNSDTSNAKTDKSVHDV